MKKLILISFALLIGVLSYGQKLKSVYTLPTPNTITGSRLLVGDPIYVMSTKQLSHAVTNLAAGSTVPSTWLSKRDITVDSAIFTGTITGGSLMRGSANFTATRKVVKIPVKGVRTTDYVFIQPTSSDSTTAVLNTDNLTVYPKTDTIIVKRSAAGTSGLTFDWFRIK